MRAVVRADGTSEGGLRWRDVEQVEDDLHAQEATTRDAQLQWVPWKLDSVLHVLMLRRR